MKKLYFWRYDVCVLCCRGSYYQQAPIQSSCASIININSPLVHRLPVWTANQANCANCANQSTSLEQLQLLVVWSWSSDMPPPFCLECECLECELDINFLIYSVQYFCQKKLCVKWYTVMDCSLTCWHIDFTDWSSYSYCLCTIKRKVIQIKK